MQIDGNFDVTSVRREFMEFIIIPLRDTQGSVEIYW